MEWNESSEARRGCQFVSSMVSRDVALALGAASLHSNLAETSVSTTRVVCPSAQDLQRILPKPNTWYHAFYTEMMLAAERSGASQVDFFVDYRKHPAQRVIQPSFQTLQEEAICVHIHDVVLTTNDVNQLFKGEMSRLGYLSGFFFSDCLQILSGDGFYVLDPTSGYLSDGSTSTSAHVNGSARRYDILAEDFTPYPDQLLPFCTLPSCPSDVGSGTRSTLLRFPWRKMPSSLSDYVIDSTKIDRFVEFLRNQLRDSLIFTESVHRMTVWSVGKGSELTVHAHGEASLDTPEYTLKRRAVTRMNTEWKKKFSFQSFFKSPVIPESQIEFVVKLEIENKRFKDTWLLADNIGFGRSRDLASTPVHEMLNSTPYVSVACHLLRDGNPVRPVRGRLFKIVDTGQEIGLPVHVNGCFKKQLKETSLSFQQTGSLEMNDEASIKAQWNRVLLEDSVVDAYLKLLLVAKRRSEASVPKAFYRVWPTLTRNNAVGSLIQSRLYQCLNSQEFFLCTDGNFRSLSGGYVVDVAGMDLPVVSFAQLHFPSFDVPSNVLIDTRRLLPSRVHSLTPRTMRRFLRNVRSTDVVSSVCLPLLEYCLSDMTFPLPNETHAIWSEFQGLPILPLEDGNVGVLGANQRGKYILGSFNQIQLLAPMSGLFVSLDARQHLQAYFSDSRFVASMGLAHFSIKTLSDHIERVLPGHWKGQVIVDWDPDRHREINRLWLFRFWAEVRFERRSLAYFSAWPLVPIQGNRLLTCGKPDAALCVWGGSIDRGLREELKEQMLVMAAQNEVRLIKLNEERKTLKNLTSDKLQRDDVRDVFVVGDENVGDTDHFMGDVDEVNHEDGTTGVGPASVEESMSEDDSPSPLVEVAEGIENSLTDPSVGTDAESNGEAPINSTDMEVALLDGVGQPIEQSPAVAVSAIQSEMTNDTQRQALHELLTRVNASMVELAYFDGQEREIVPASRDLAIAILDAVSSSNVHMLNWGILSEAEGTHLAEYFSAHSQAFGGYNRMQIEMLQRLPIYANICGVACALDRGGYYLIPPEIDLTAVPLPPNSRQCFLRANPNLNTFYRELGVQDMSYAKLLVFVLPFFDQMLRDQRETILRLIREKWSTLRGDADVSAIVRSTRLFIDDEGTYRSADSYFDPRNKVLQTIYRDSVCAFPAEQYATPEWLNLMGEIGLRSEITVDLFIECARRLEATYSNKLTLETQDEVVVNAFHQYFTQNFEKYDRSRTFFDQISRIAFVPAVVYENAVSSTPTNVAAMVTRTVMKTYSSCVTPDDQALAFSNMPVLMASALPPRVLWSRLGLQSPPDKATVLNHLDRLFGDGSGSIAERWHFYLPIVDVFQEIFKFLQNGWSQLTADEREKLIRSAIIPVGSRLVKGSRLFFHLPDNLAPLMFEVPRAFGAYDTLFRELGSKDAPEAQDYVVLLQDFYNECGAHSLNLNELLGVTRVVGLLADRLSQTNQSLSVEARHNLYLPSTSSSMRSVLHMAYNDAPWICTRINLAELHLVHPRVSSRRCEVLGVSGVSKVVTEELDVQSLIRLVKTPDEVHHFNTVLASPQFGNGLRTIISAQQQKAHGDDGVASAIDFDELHQRIVDLATYQVQAVETLRSSFVAKLGHPPRRVDVTKNSAATDSISFIDRSSRVIYVAMSTLQARPGMRSSQVVAQCINQLLGGVLQECGIIESILSCDVIDIQPLLRFMNVYEDPELIVERLRGTAGELLSRGDQELVELAPLRSFYVGEIVAIDIDGALRYGRVIQEETVSSGLHNFEVRIGRTETRWYPATQIYCFRSTYAHTTAQSFEGRDASFVERLTSATGSVTTSTPQQLPSSVVAHGDVRQQPSAPATPLTIVTAVNDLLSRLNLSLDSSYEELIAENLRLQHRLEQAEEGRRLATAQIDEAIREKRDAQDSLVCAICLENNVDRVLIPCGHIYCSACVAQLPRQRCPICRERIASTSLFHVPS